MKRILVWILLFALVFSAFSVCGVASAESTSPYELAASYVAKHARRDVPSGAEKSAAGTISDYLTARGYTVTLPDYSVTVEDANGKKVSYKGCHVIGFKDNGKGKTILLGGYYGGYEPTDSEGVGDGASAALTVGLLLYLADALASAPLDYDLAFGFWGGMEIASDFDAKNCGVAIDSLALYVNFDCIAAGRSDYLYADDLPRSQESYFRSIAEEQGAEILSAPTFKKPASFAVAGDYSYLHLGLIGANRNFMNAGVPCLNFVGGAWDYEDGLYRYPGKGDLEGTKLDTLAEIDKLNGGSDMTAARLLSVANVVIAGLGDARLSPALDEAAKELSAADLNSDLAYYLIIFIGGGLLLVVFVILIVKQRKDRRDTVWTPSFGSDPGGKDPYEELRSDDPAPPSDAPFEPRDPSGGDDIFRF